MKILNEMSTQFLYRVQLYLVDFHLVQAMKIKRHFNRMLTACVLTMWAIMTD